MYTPYLTDCCGEVRCYCCEGVDLLRSIYMYIRYVVFVGLTMNKSAMTCLYAMLLMVHNYTSSVNVYIYIHWWV